MSVDDPGVLGRAVRERLRPPGRPHNQPRPSQIGSLAHGAQRFAASTARPIPIRRALQGPGTPRAGGYRQLNTAPPRWWTPVARDEQTLAVLPATEDLPRRGLPRAVRRVPDEKTWTPGGIVESLTSEVARVRRWSEVAAAGPMLMSHDIARLSAARSSPGMAPSSAATPAGGTPDGTVRRSSIARQGASPPGQHPGGGSGSRAPEDRMAAASGNARRRVGTNGTTVGGAGTGVAHDGPRVADARTASGAADAARPAGAQVSWLPALLSRFAGLVRRRTDSPQREAVPVSRRVPAGTRSFGRHLGADVPRVARAASAAAGAVGAFRGPWVSAVVRRSVPGNPGAVSGHRPGPLGPGPHSTGGLGPGGHSTGGLSVGRRVSAGRPGGGRYELAGPPAGGPSAGGLAVGGSGLSGHGAGTSGAGYGIGGHSRDSHSTDRRSAGAHSADGPRVSSALGAPLRRALSSARPLRARTSTAAAPLGLPAYPVRRAASAQSMPAPRRSGAPAASNRAQAPAAPVAPAGAHGLADSGIIAAQARPSSPAQTLGAQPPSPGAGVPAQTDPASTTTPAASGAGAPGSPTRQPAPPSTSPSRLAPTPASRGALAPDPADRPAVLARDRTGPRAIQRQLAADGPSPTQRARERAAGFAVASLRPLPTTRRASDAIPAAGVARTTALPTWAVGRAEGMSTGRGERTARLGRSTPALHPAAARTNAASASVGPFVLPVLGRTVPPGRAGGAIARRLTTVGATRGAASAAMLAGAARADTGTTATTSGNGRAPLGSPSERTVPISASTASTVPASASAATPTGTAVPMPELLSTQRPAAHGRQHGRMSGLARSIGADEDVRPLGAGHSAAAAPTAAQRPRPVSRAAAAARRRMSEPSAQREPRQQPRRSSASRLGGTTLLRATTATAGALTISRTLVPAPPPLGNRAGTSSQAPLSQPPPSPPGTRSSRETASESVASTGAAASAAAAASGRVAQQPPSPSIRRSLVEATAELFRSAGVGQPATIRRSEQWQGQAMTDNLPVRPERVLPAAAEPARPSLTPLAGDDEVANPAAARHLDALVDLVVDRIERRVVDELERRGQRHNPGVF